MQWVLMLLHFTSMGGLNLLLFGKYKTYNLPPPTFCVVTYCACVCVSLLLIAHISAAHLYILLYILSNTHITVKMGLKIFSDPLNLP